MSDNNTDIACWIYSEAYKNSSVQPIQYVIQFKTVFYLKEKILVQFDHMPQPQWWWCLGIRSSRLERVDDVPSNATNILGFPTIALAFMNLIIETVTYVEFHGSAAAGFAYLSEDCDLNQRPLNNTCILKVKGASYVIAPGDGDFSPLDILFHRILNLYFKTMGGVLEYLMLSSGLMGNFASAWLEELQYTNIKHLDASNNNFNGNNGVLPHRFKNLTYLTTISMQHCKLTGINAENFKATPNLEFLDISNNLFKSPPKGLKYLSKLKTLNIGLNESLQNGSTFILNTELMDLVSLRNLNLSGLPLNHIARSSLPKYIESLDLSKCGLTSIAHDTFYDLQNLKELILTSNKIRTLDSLTFKNMEYGNIILKRNEIKKGQNLKFKNLNLLDLSYNHIQNPLNIIKYGLIKHLDLNNNEIINWTSPIIFNSNNYTILNINLSYNNIPMIIYEMIPSLNLLNSIDFGGNLINCQDCSLKITKRWLNTTNTTILNNGYKNPLKCYLPIQERNKFVFNATYNITACELPPINYLLIAVLPCGIIFTVTSITMIILYVYRFEIMYIKHLYRIKKRNESISERDGCKYDVFVSYCGKDRDWVMDVLLPALENPNDRYVLCLHERDFLLGIYIMDNIVSCIDQSRRVILVLSNNYIKSQWCQWELQMAQHRIFEDSQDFLVLLELEQVERENVPLHLRTLMSTRTYLEWPAQNLSVVNLTSFWSRLKDALGTALALTKVLEDNIQTEVEDYNSELDSDDELLYYHEAD